MSMLSIGIVGLPNAGKSSLFKALTREQVDIANFPFTTVEPNVGIVKVPDPRLEVLTKISESKKTTYAAIKFLDIAGLIKGAHKGEGLGNEFLADIKECDAILLVLRGFGNKDIVHTEGEVDPARDAGILKVEMIMKDLEQIEKVEERLHRETAQNKDKIKELTIIQQWLRNLQAGSWRELETPEEKILDRSLNLLSAKPIIAALNINDRETLDTDHKTWAESMIKNINQEFNGVIGENILAIDVKTESELADFPEEDAKEWRGRYQPLEGLIKKCYDALDLITFLTTGPEETRAWAIKKGITAQQAAGVIHSDFEKNFIRAEIISYEELVSFGVESSVNAWQKAKEAGKIRLEGKAYIVQDGDVVFFRIGK